eukprot:COSAG01_NODE_32768_length_575_cov_2.787815_1_plen_107_part_10
MHAQQQQQQQQERTCPSWMHLSTLVEGLERVWDVFHPTKLGCSGHFVPPDLVATARDLGHRWVDLWATATLLRRSSSTSSSSIHRVGLLYERARCAAAARAAAAAAA